MKRFSLLFVFLLSFQSIFGQLFFPSTDKIDSVVEVITMRVQPNSNSMSLRKSRKHFDKNIKYTYFITANDSLELPLVTIYDRTQFDVKLNNDSTDYCGCLGDPDSYHQDEDIIKEYPQLFKDYREQYVGVGCSEDEVHDFSKNGIVVFKAKLKKGINTIVIDKRNENSEILGPGLNQEIIQGAALFKTLLQDKTKTFVKVESENLKPSKITFNGHELKQTDDSIRIKEEFFTVKNSNVADSKYFLSVTYRKVSPFMFKVIGGIVVLIPFLLWYIFIYKKRKGGFEKIFDIIIPSVLCPIVSILLFTLIHTSVEFSLFWFLIVVSIYVLLSFILLVLYRAK